MPAWCCGRVSTLTYSGSRRDGGGATVTAGYRQAGYGHGLAILDLALPLRIDTLDTARRYQSTRLGACSIARLGQPRLGNFVDVRHGRSVRYLRRLRLSVFAYSSKTETKHPPPPPGEPVSLVSESRDTREIGSSGGRGRGGETRRRKQSIASRHFTFALSVLPAVIAITIFGELECFAQRLG